MSEFAVIIFSPSHFCPHQQISSAFIIQVPLPQQRLSSITLFQKTRQYKKAEANYLKIIAVYKDEILADDAYFNLANLYEHQLQDPQKAKQYYEQIIFDFADSIYFTQARKKYRMLRGK